ncbi:hypothetical protein CRUP_001703, partial [Coryphaenoides rupestris]
MSQSSRLSSSVSAMRVLNPGSDVEEALADALLLGDMRTKVSLFSLLLLFLLLLLPHVASVCACVCVCAFCV